MVEVAAATAAKDRVVSTATLPDPPCTDLRRAQLILDDDVDRDARLRLRRQYPAAPPRNWLTWDRSRLGTGIKARCPTGPPLLPVVALFGDGRGLARGRDTRPAQPARGYGARQQRHLGPEKAPMHWPMATTLADLAPQTRYDQVVTALSGGGARHRPAEIGPRRVGPSTPACPISSTSSLTRRTSPRKTMGVQLLPESPSGRSPTGSAGGTTTRSTVPTAT